MFFFYVFYVIEDGKHALHGVLFMLKESKF